MTPRLSDEHLAELVSHVTETMLGIRFAGPAADSWRAALLAIGDGAVTVGLSSNQAGCAILGARLFSCAAKEVDVDMVDDSLRELVNMTAGRIKSALMLDLALGLPRVVTDCASLPVTQSWRVVRLRASTVDLTIWLYIQPTAAMGAER
jgi:hypothetical protein